MGRLGDAVCLPEEGDGVAGSWALLSPHPQLFWGLEAGSGREMGGAERVFFW